MDLQSAKYHADCYQSIKNSAQAYNYDNADEKLNPRSLIIQVAMEEIYKYIEENNDCQFSIQELKNILSTEYREFFTENWCNGKCNNIENEEFRVLKTAGEIIRRSIRSQVYCNNFYSASDKMFMGLDEYIPKPQRFLLSEIILIDKKSKPENIPDYEIKCKSIAHAIIAALRIRSFISPLHVALAVMFHRKFGSKKIIKICNNLGFCAAYKEARLYDVSAAVANPRKIKKGTFVQFVHDNADFNVNTINGRGTFHNMGSIEIVTPGDGIEAREPIKRLKEIPSESTIAETGNTSIEVYPVSAGEGFEKMYIQLSEKEPDIQQPTVLSRFNILWMYLKFKKDNKFPGWNGFINLLTTAQDFDKSTIIFLPFINAAPSETRYILQ